jgi:hypothetical protein
LLYTVIVLSVFYALIEGVATWLWMRGTLEPESHWVYENNGTGWSYSFDPLTGFALSPVPARMATTASNGVIESTGTIRGNNLGFPDERDFVPRPEDPDRLRVAVFGDSFTAGYYTPRPWPALAGDAAPHIDFLNFGVDGGGLTNWWSVATRLLAPRDYEFDGVAFAVFGDDLFRLFSINDDGYRDDPSADVYFGRVPMSLIDHLPETRNDARPYLEPVERYDRVSTERFDALLRGDWHPRSRRPFRPFFANLALGLVRGREPAEGSPDGRTFAAVHYRMMDEMGAAFAERGIPMLAIYLPWRDELIGGPVRFGSPEEVREFARRIGADFLDGSEAFAALDREAVADCFLRYDGHFSERGMQQFAGYVAARVDEWLNRQQAKK